MVNKILFVGSFLSLGRGTKGISEKLADMLVDSPNLQIVLASRYENKILRLLDIVVRVFFLKYRYLHADVFSGRSFFVAEVAVAIAHWRSKSVLLTLRGGMLPKFYATHPKRVEKLFRRANFIMTPSLFLQAFFKERSFSIEYIPNGIDARLFFYDRPHVGSPVRLLWVRAFSSIYNPSLAVKVLHYVRQKFPDATLTMVGPDKGLLTDVQILADRLSLKEYIDIVGPVANNELPKYCHSHSVFLNTTSYESFGVAVMEAAACGIPIVSTCVGEIPFLWKDEEEILMVEKQDAMLFAEQVIRILTDDNLAEKLSRNARQKAEQYDWGRLLPKWIELLSD